MKLALIGDPHFANKKLFGFPTGTPGVNGRLQNAIDVFEWILNDLPNDINEVCILGDITHDHGHLTPPVLNAVRDLFADFNDAGFNLTIISGNHDIDSTGASIIPAFENYNTFECPGVEAITFPRQIYWSYSVPIYAIPYCSHDKTIEALKQIESDYKVTKTKCIVLMHHHFEGAVHGVHEFEPPGGINPKDIPECVLMVISGHYHTAQDIDDRISYIGVPVQQDFGEANNKPMYWILDIANDGLIEIEQREIRVGSRFHILPHNLALKDIPGDPQKDYYRIDLPQDVDPTSINELQDKLTNVIVKVIPVAAAIRSRVEEHLQKDAGKIDVFDVVEAYGAMNAVPERADALIELGKDIVTRS